MKKFDVKSIFMGLIAGVTITYGVGFASTLVTGDVYFSSYPIFVNGKYYSTTNPVLNYNGRTYLPLNELGSALGGSVTFNNNAIYVSSYNNGYVDSSGDRDKVYNFTQTVEKDIEIDEGSSESYYVSLSRYGARSATITGANSYVKVNKASVTYSGDIKLTGIKEGKATIKITYSTGDVEKLYVEVNDSDYEDEEEMEVGETYKVRIDLDKYDADEAKVTYDSDYVSVSKNKFTSDGTLTIKAKDEGKTTVKIKYDSGDIQYIYLKIYEDDDYYNDCYDEIKVEEGDYEYVYIDLEEYDATSAELTYSNKSYIKLDKTYLTSSGKVKITGKNEGYTSVKVKFNTGEIVYIDVEVYD